MYFRAVFQACAGLVALGFLVTGAACAQQPYTITPNEGSMPPSLELPQLSGGLDEIAEQVCSWATRNEIAYPPGIENAVYVESVAGPDGGRYVAWDLITRFVESETPRLFFVNVDISARPETVAGSRSLFALMNRSGIWSLEKVAGEQCAQGHGAVVTRSDARQLCVAVQIRETAPDASITRADVRNLYLRIRGGEIQSYQMLQVRVTTLQSSGAIVGRRIHANLYASHTQAGGLNHNCDSGGDSL